MENIKKFSFLLVLTVLIVLFTSMTAVAEETTNEPVINPIADVTIGANGIGWTPKVSYARLELRVSGPDGTVFSKIFDSGSSPYLGLSDNNGKYFTDGSYTYELRVIPSYEEKVRSEEENIEETPRVQQLVQSGHFIIMGGGFVTPTNSPEPGLAKPLDQVFIDDLIVIGSACIGQDCANGESFGFDTIRLKENNLRIRFYDTSVSAGFPTNDWQLTANDSASGGASYFAIDDIDSGRQPFKVLAGTRANAIYVDSSGRVGFGTSTPSEDLQIWYGDTPTIRLDQSGSGWAPQTWDISGNEANFFIRDVTNGGLLPLRIQPSAPTNSIFVKSDGKIGMGTQAPGFCLEVAKTGAASTIVANMTDGATAILAGGASFAFMGAKSNHDLRLLVNDSPKMILSTDGKVGIGVTSVDAANKLQVDNGAKLTTGGAWVDGSSREFKENIKDLTDDEAVEALSGLTPVTFNYKKEKQEKYVGFIAEDVPELVAMSDRKGLSPMDIVAVLTKVVQRQQKIVEGQQKTISELTNRIAELEKK